MLAGFRRTGVLDSIFLSVYDIENGCMQISLLLLPVLAHIVRQTPSHTNIMGAAASTLDATSNLKGRMSYRDILPTYHAGLKLPVCLWQGFTSVPMFNSQLARGEYCPFQVVHVKSTPLQSLVTIINMACDSHAHSVKTWLISMRMVKARCHTFDYDAHCRRRCI